MTTPSHPLQYISEEELRAEAVRQLGIEDVSPEAQDEIILMVRETILEYINIGVMKALGPEGMKALADIDETSDAFAKKMLKLLPNIGEIAKTAIEGALQNHRLAVSQVRSRFGMPTDTKVSPSGQGG